MDFLKYGKTYPKKGFNVKGLLILFLVKLFLITVYLIILDITGLDKFDYDDRFDQLIKDSPLLILLLVGVLAPFGEELVFRFPLNIKLKSFLVALAFSILVMFSEFWPLMLAYILILLSIFIVKKIGKPVPLKWLVYFSSAIFALIHLGNYQELDFLAYWYLMPFLVLSQFFGGLILCFLRLSHGLWLAIYFHAFWNTVLMSLVIWATQWRYRACPYTNS
ncbi:CPBP family intramembrane metalloprotease [Litoribacter alkaliphilus]|uniref:CPBP family intramembrane metalloprotease n=1 Tax=Litoribacter ruber TaxID=702568 RepID=A0AAP2G3R9_9BACT|nr:CPBP family glutamic-type intramembrane protease [Litoribacter alkaliphilus]MBS9523760.1 CPBP family intramembrane metalloprotease [Litoribacter alkaliphilus]